MSICDSTLESVTSVRDACPAHYSFKIESFSGLLMLLTKTGKENYETCDFEVGGYNWKLSLYPNGDKKLNTTDHMSLYLVFSDTNAQQPLRAEATAFFRLFLYDQIKDKYYMVEDVSQKPVRFHAMKTESGFSHFIPFSMFHDTANGYLVRDCCIFGAEVFVTNSTGKGESFIVLKDPQMTPFSWKIDNFSMLVQGDSFSSSVFTVGRHNWYLGIFPDGYGTTKGKYLSVFLYLQDLSSEQKLWCEYKLRLKDQIKGEYYERSGNNLWGASRSTGTGWSKFLLLSDLKDKSRGFLVNDTLLAEVQITLIRKTTNFS